MADLTEEQMREAARFFGAQGGKKSSARMSPERRSEIGRLGGHASVRKRRELREQRERAEREGVPCKVGGKKRGRKPKSTQGDKASH